jgi:hypothetical protein
LTPWQTQQAQIAYGLALEQEHDRQAWMMWHGAVLSKDGVKPPPLKEFYTGFKKAVKAIDEDDIKRRLFIYNDKLKEETGLDSGSTINS